MMALSKSLMTGCLALLSFLVYPQEKPDSLPADSMDWEKAVLAYQGYVDSILATFNYTTGEVKLGDGLASMLVPSGFKYLSGKEAETVLVDLWGNPPSGEQEKSLGMLIPEDLTPMSDSMYAINITYSEEGFVDDKDAGDIDYDELLDQMQGDMVESNQYREENGYETVELVGWASEPFYDAANKKLHWAKELRFGEAEENTLNYNIRVLGRRGYLQLNIIGEMFLLDKVKSNMEHILPSVSFDEGNRYADFDPSIDKVAAYGLSGLIAGKILMKAGLLAKLGIFLAKFWKIIAIAVIGIGAGLKKYFSKAEKEKPTL